jgi:hypothetical protein
LNEFLQNGLSFPSYRPQSLSYFSILPLQKGKFPNNNNWLYCQEIFIKNCETIKVFLINLGLFSSETLGVAEMAGEVMRSPRGDRIN